MGVINIKKDMKISILFLKWKSVLCCHKIIVIQANNFGFNQSKSHYDISRCLDDLWHMASARAILAVKSWRESEVRDVMIVCWKIFEEKSRITDGAGLIYIHLQCLMCIASCVYVFSGGWHEKGRFLVFSDSTLDQTKKWRIGSFR